ncbi:hypothetical protein [Lysinibacillus agricola]|uniref:hypothetical protein n=1 Tax=Lysinibacillus agricola TaxID=2590012 RepID=UPI003C276717
MKKYEKMLVAFNDEEFNSFAKQGEWLYIANKRDTKKRLFRLPHYKYFFVALNSQRTPSEYGVVKRIEGNITAAQLAELDYQSRKQDVSLIDETILNEYELFLEKVNAQPEHTPMAVTWHEKVLLKKEKKLRVHKVFFTGLTKEEKAELFEF